MDRFIVGTGRCGSTLLSRMIAEHERTLSIFEFFTGLDIARRFTTEPIDGPAFAALIARENPIVTMVVRRGYQVPEITYPFDTPGARYRRDDGLPWVLVSALPDMTDAPDTLFEETMAFASALPAQPVAAHYRRLFDWWTRRMGRAQWIERSGSSIDYLGGLHTLFPQARFLHIHRDGHEAALSMREHAPYRLAVSLLFQLPPEGMSLDELGKLDPKGPPRADDLVSKILASEPPVEYFGRYWSQEIEHGARARAALDDGRYMEIAFEELIADPTRVLRSIGDFFELGDGGGWLDRAAGLVRGVPPARFDKLPADERARLAEACRPGMELLARRR
jgi:hypothetical protein